MYISLRCVVTKTSFTRITNRIATSVVNKNKSKCPNHQSSSEKIESKQKLWLFLSTIGWHSDLADRTTTTTTSPCDVCVCVREMESETIRKELQQLTDVLACVGRGRPGRRPGSCTCRKCVCCAPCGRGWPAVPTWPLCNRTGRTGTA